MKKFLGLLVLLCLTCAFNFNDVPYLKPTVSGSLCTESDPDFSEYRYSQQIPYCKRNVTYERKLKIYSDYHIPKSEHSNYTIDHIIPLSIGGSNREENLWPEHKKIKACREHMEITIFKKVRAGELTQSDAIEYIKDIKYDKICTEN